MAHACFFFAALQEHIHRLLLVASQRKPGFLQVNKAGVPKQINIEVVPSATGYPLVSSMVQAGAVLCRLVVAWSRMFWFMVLGQGHAATP